MGRGNGEGEWGLTCKGSVRGHLMKCVDRKAVCFAV